MRKILTLVMLGAGILLLGAGCGAKNQGDLPGKGNGFEKNQGARGNGQFDNGFRGMNFATGTVANLTVGVKVTATGASNSDGSLSATRIMVGDMPMMNFRSSTPPSTTPSVNTPAGNGNQNVQRQGNRNSGQAVNWGGAQTGGNAQMPNRANLQNSARGEIISISAGSFVVKLSDGGSRMVFYSPSTEIMIFQPLASTPSENQL
ncbi:MAG: hypothetical protein WCX97_03145 [Candidatus Magasanikbacteria bacterium]